MNYIVTGTWDIKALGKNNAVCQFSPHLFIFYLFVCLFIYPHPECEIDSLIYDFTIEKENEIVVEEY